jgi:hypothetical protein
MTSMSNRPENVQIRIDGNEWRYHGIERAQKLYECNRSDAIAYACEDISQLASRIEEVLSRDDFTHQQRRELAETLSTSSLSFEVDVEISTTTDT